MAFGVAFAFPCYPGWSPAFLGLPEHLPAHGNQWMNSLLCLSTQVLLSLLSCLHLNPWDFSLLFCWFSPPSTVGEWVSGCMGLNCWLGLNHNNSLDIFVVWVWWIFVSVVLVCFLLYSMNGMEGKYHTVCQGFRLAEMLRCLCIIGNTLSSTWN